MANAAVFEEALRKIMEAEQSFRRACGQIFVLNRVLQDLQRRYDMAAKEHMRAFRYHLRLRIAVMEGVRNMFYAYANQKADLITELRKELILSEENLADSDLNSEFVDDESDYDFSDSDFPYSDYDEEGEFDDDDDEFGYSDDDYAPGVGMAGLTTATSLDEHGAVGEASKDADTSFLDKTNEEDGFDL